jgi:hypothetical protein
MDIAASDMDTGTGTGGEHRLIVMGERVRVNEWMVNGTMSETFFCSIHHDSIEFRNAEIVLLSIGYLTGRPSHRSAGHLLRTSF